MPLLEVRQLAIAYGDAPGRVGRLAGRRREPARLGHRPCARAEERRRISTACCA